MNIANSTNLGFCAGKATRAIQRFLKSQATSGGKTSRQELMNLFFSPEKGVFVLKQKYIAEIIQLHKNLGLLSLHVAHTQEYTMPRDAFLDIVKYHIPNVYFSIPKPDAIPETVVLIREPGSKEVASYGIDYFRRYFWSLLFHAEVHKIQMQWEKTNSFPENKVYGFIQQLGRDVYEEIRDVLDAENSLFDPDNPKEVVYEFIAYFLQYYHFAPRLLGNLFPLIQKSKKMYETIQSLGIDDERLLEAVRPEDAMSTQAILLQRDAEIDGYDQELAIFQSTYYLESIARSPSFARMGITRSKFEHEYTAFCRGLVQEIVHKSRIVGELNIGYVMDKIAAGNVEMNKKQLLAFDSMLADGLSLFYRRASWAQRLLIRMRSDNFLQKPELKAAREQISQKTMSRFQNEQEKAKSGRSHAWLRALFFPLILLFQLVFYLPIMALRHIAAFFEHHFLWALRIADSMRIRDFVKLAQKAAQKERRGNMAGAFLDYKDALSLASQVHRRFFFTNGFYGSLRSETERKLKAIEEKFCEENGLSGESRDHLKELLDFFLEEKQLPRTHRWILYDMQKSYIDAHKEYFRLSLLPWLATFGRRKLKQPLVSIPIVKKLKALQSVQKRVYRLKMRERELRHCKEAIDIAYHHAEDELRQKLGVFLNDALIKAGIKPRPYKMEKSGVEEKPDVEYGQDGKPIPHTEFLRCIQQETIAFHKIREEILDLIIARGHIQFSDLRDVISRNYLKLDDLKGIIEFVTGDPLLRFDRFVGRDLEGVHRPAELYMGWLHRFNSFLFGWPVGRWISKYVLLPFIGGFVIFETFCHIGHGLAGWQMFHDWMEPAYRVYVENRISYEWQQILAHSAHFPQAWIWVFVFSFAILCCIYTSFGRAVWNHTVHTIGHLLKIGFLDIPRFTWQSSSVQFLYKLKLWTYVRSFLVKPLVYSLPVVLPVYYFCSIPLEYVALSGWILGNLVIHHPKGRLLVDSLEDMLVDLVLQINAIVFLRLFQTIMEGFKSAVAFVENILYTVDDFFRFRKGEFILTQLVKAFFGMLWRVVTYIFRFTVNLIVEPQINPIKHFPIVTVSHKLIVPFAILLMNQSEAIAKPYIGSWDFLMHAWKTLVFLIIQFGIPGVCGFIAWEFQSNWKIYRRSASSKIKPAMVGSHGEDIPKLLKTGFHSGTIPKLFRKMRKAAHYANKTGDWTSVNKLEYHRHHICEDIQKFVERLFVAQFTNNIRIQEQEVKVESKNVSIYPHKIVMPLHIEIKGKGSFSFEIHHEFREGAIVSSLCFPDLPQEIEEYFQFALLVFWKVSGINLCPKLTDDYIRKELSLDDCDLDYSLEGHILSVQVCSKQAFDVTGRISFDLTKERPESNMMRPLPGQTMGSLSDQTWKKTLEREKLMVQFHPLSWETYTIAAQKYAESGKLKN